MTGPVIILSAERVRSYGRSLVLLKVKSYYWEASRAVTKSDYIAVSVTGRAIVQSPS